MTASSSLRIRVLDRDESDAILTRNSMGRLAYVYERVDIEPMHYVYADGVIYGRTSAGPKLIKLQHNQWVAFEVDEVDGLQDWRSVVIQGSFYPVEDEDSESSVPEPASSTLYARTLGRIRELVPEALLDGDPTPRRTSLFRIHIDSVSGRAAGREVKEARRR